MTWVLLVASTAALAFVGAVSAWTLRISRGERLLAGSTAALLFVVVVSTVVGWALRSYRPVPLFLGSLVAAMITAAISLRSRERASPAAAPDTDPEASESDRARSSPVLTAVLWLMIVLGAVETVLRTILALGLPPYGADTLTYHLPAIEGWVQAGRIGTNPLSIFAAHYPMNGELIAGWSVVFLRSTVLYNLTQVVLGLAGAAAVAGLARLFGASKLMRRAAGALYLLIPIVAAQATTGYVDITYASLLLIAMYWLLRTLQALRAGSGGEVISLTALTGAATGVMLGTKVTGYVYAPLIVVALAVALTLYTRRGNLSATAAASSGVLCLVLVLVAGATWPLHDLITEHNPLYPASFNIGPIHAAGVSSATSYIETAPAESGAIWPLQVLHSWLHDAVLGSHGYDFYNYDQRSGGLGTTWILLGLPCLIVAGVAALRRRNPLAVTALAILVVGYLAQPYKWWSRFTVELAAAGILAIVWAIRRLGPRAGALLATAALVTAGYDCMFDSWTINLGTHHTVTAGQVLGDIADGHRVSPSAVDPTYRSLLTATGSQPMDVAVDATFFPPLSPLYGRTLHNHVVELTVGLIRRIDHHADPQPPAYAVAPANSRLTTAMNNDTAAFHLISSDRFEHVAVYRVG